jgi:glyoxylase I family protein
MTTPAISSIHHVTVNVQDVDRSERWYTEVLGFQRMTQYETDDFRRVIMCHPDGSLVLGLNRHSGSLGDEPFDERRAGLDHIALQVPDKTVLERWVEHFERFDVPHSEIKPAAVPGSFLVTFRDPDNIQYEVFAPPGTA